MDEVETHLWLGLLTARFATDSSLHLLDDGSKLLQCWEASVHGRRHPCGIIHAFLTWAPSFLQYLGHCA